MKNFQSFVTLLSILTLSIALGACTSQGVSGDTFSPGKAQREIRVGMPASEVAQALGSPNIVTKDDLRDEVWIYDKVATDVVRTQDSSDAWTMILLNSSSAKNQTGEGAQRTLTVFIKFDEQQRVRGLSYHTSDF